MKLSNSYYTVQYIILYTVKYSIIYIIQLSIYDTVVQYSIVYRSSIEY